MTEFSPRHEQEQFATRRMVVKIGSSTITEGGTVEQPLNLGLIDNIARQCSILHKSGVEVAVVSSGAVACGRKILEMDEKTIFDRQIEAIYGQSTLTHAWQTAFGKYGVPAGLLLLKETDLENPLPTLNKALKQGVPVINANDATSSNEMRQLLVSADNDKLAGFVARAVGADTVLILTDVEGVKDTNGCVVFDGAGIDETVVFEGTSKTGTGGMASKVDVLRKLSFEKTRGVIAAAEGDIILDVARGTATGCTIFEAKT